MPMRASVLSTTGSDWYLLASKINSQHAAAAIVCIAQPAQELMLLVIAQPRICHLGAHLHTHDMLTWHAQATVG